MKANLERAESESAQFEEAFRQYWPRVVGVLLRLTDDPAEAEDLALETFWRLYRRPPRAEGLNLAGWLLRVATNLGYNALRAAGRRARYEQEAGLRALTQSAAPPDPAQTVEQTQEREQTRLVLSRMKARSAQLLVLRHSGLSYAEIAATLSLAPGSIGTLLARAEGEFEQEYRRATQGRRGE